MFMTNQLLLNCVSQFHWENVLSMVKFNKFDASRNINKFHIGWRPAKTNQYRAVKRFCSLEVPISTEQPINTHISPLPHWLHSATVCVTHYEPTSQDVPGSSHPPSHFCSSKIWRRDCVRSSTSLVNMGTCSCWWLDLENIEKHRKTMNPCTVLSSQEVGRWCSRL